MNRGRGKNGKPAFAGGLPSAVSIRSQCPAEWRKIQNRITPSDNARITKNQNMDRGTMM
jgi:hypothetical protein